jgi:aminoglycoside/choline kinase family phosphotransferase
MDSSRQKESLTPFIDMTYRLSSAGVTVPYIYEKNLNDGFLLLEDLGSRDLLSLLDEQNYQSYYSKAIDEIIKIQRSDTADMLPYDREFLISEMELMQRWYLGVYLELELDKSDLDIIKYTISTISDIVLSQPQGVFVHRDFHSRNIMVQDGDRLGIIDHQDARVGAITYDLVSLLRDLYISFDRSQIERLALSYRDRSGLVVDDELFMRWFDFMGLQRHIKVLGIFARLSIRDGKDGYIDDIPQTLRYIKDIGSSYSEMRPLLDLFDKLGV